MAITVSPKRFSDGIARGQTGTFTGDGGVATVNTGYRPKRVVLINLTDVVQWEKIDGMTDAQCMKTVAAGTLTVDTTSAIVLNDRGFTVPGSVAINAKSFVFQVQ